MQIRQFLTWKNLAIVLLLAIVLGLTGKLSYDRGYNRGEHDAQINSMLNFINHQDTFLDDTKLSCQLNLYEIMTRNASDGTQGKMWKDIGNSCGELVNGAVIKLKLAR
jgi:hypothetical protein